MLKLAMIMVLAIYTTIVSGGFVVPAAPLVAAAPTVAVHAVPVGSSYSNTYRAPVVKAAPVYIKPALLAPTPLLHAAPITPIKAAPLIAAAPIVHTAPAILKSAPVIAHPPAIALAPVATSYAASYKAPLIKSHVVAAPAAIVH